MLVLEKIINREVSHIGRNLVVKNLENVVNVEIEPHFTVFHACSAESVGHSVGSEIGIAAEIGGKHLDFVVICVRPVSRVFKNNRKRGDFNDLTDHDNVGKFRIRISFTYNSFVCEKRQKQNCGKKDNQKLFHIGLLLIEFIPLDNISRVPYDIEFFLSENVGTGTESNSLTRERPSDAIWSHH